MSAKNKDSKSAAPAISDAATRKQKHCILVVDDHPMTRAGLAQVISDEPDLTVCAEATNAREGMEAVERLKPDLVLTDITLPGKSGLEFIKDVVAMHPGLPVLAASMHNESLYAERVLHAGGRGYIMKSETGERIVAAIRHVLSGQVYVSEQMAARLLESFSSGRSVSAAKNKRGSVEVLSDREFEVFQLVGQGLSSSEIGARLNMSPKTVDTHRLNIKEKLGLKSAAEVIAFAARWCESNAVEN